MSVATAYAKALYEAAIEEKATASTLDQIDKELEVVVQAVTGSKQMEAALFGSITTAKEKANILRDLAQKAGANHLVARFLELLASKNRVVMIKQIHQEFVNVRLLAEGGIPGTVVAAQPMADADVAGLAQAFTKKLGKKVKFRVSSDPSLLAGMKVTVAGVTYDGTLKSQLERLRDRFVVGSSIGVSH